MLHRHCSHFGHTIFNLSSIVKVNSRRTHVEIDVGALLFTVITAFCLYGQVFMFFVYTFVGKVFHNVMTFLKYGKYVCVCDTVNGFYVDQKCAFNLKLLPEEGKQNEIYFWL